MPSSPAGRGSEASSRARSSPVGELLGDVAGVEAVPALVQKLSYRGRGLPPRAAVRVFAAESLGAHARSRGGEAARGPRRAGARSRRAIATATRSRASVTSARCRRSRRRLLVGHGPGTARSPRSPASAAHLSARCVEAAEQRVRGGLRRESQGRVRGHARAARRRPCVRRGRGLLDGEALRSERGGARSRRALEVGRAGGAGHAAALADALVRPVQQDAEVAARYHAVLALGWIDSREKLTGAGAEIATKIDAMIAQDRGRTLTAGVNEDVAARDVAAPRGAVGRSRDRTGAGSLPYLAARFRFDVPVFSHALGRTLNGRSFATRGKSSIPPARRRSERGDPPSRGR